MSIDESTDRKQLFFETFDEQSLKTPHGKWDIQTPSRVRDAITVFMPSMDQQEELNRYEKLIDIVYAMKNDRAINYLTIIKVRDEVAVKTAAALFDWISKHTVCFLVNNPTLKILHRCFKKVKLIADIAYQQMIVEVSTERNQNDHNNEADFRLQKNIETLEQLKHEYQILMKEGKPHANS